MGALVVTAPWQGISFDLGPGLLLLVGVIIAMIVIVAFSVTLHLLTAFGASLPISFPVAGIGLVAIALSQQRSIASSSSPLSPPPRITAIQ